MQLKKNHESLPSTQDEALSHCSVSREIPRSLLKLETVLNTLHETPEVPRLTRPHSRGTLSFPAHLNLSPFAPPHLDLRLEPQGSSPVLTWISGFLWSFNRGVRPCLVWRHGTLLPSRGVKGLSGFLSIGIGILGFFLRCHGAVTPPFVF